MLFDANIGYSEEILISKFLKKYNKIVILLGNKSEKLNSKYNVSEVGRLVLENYLFLLFMGWC